MKAAAIRAGDKLTVTTNTFYCMDKGDEVTVIAHTDGRLMVECVDDHHFLQDHTDPQTGDLVDFEFVTSYDSTADTLAHIRRVNELLLTFCTILMHRAQVHDQSKLGPEEKPLFDKYTPLLKTLEYGTQEYRDNLKLLRPAIDHHNAYNSHHPEHYEDGVAGMDLADLVEMFFDWKAASERGKNGDIRKSIDVQKDRFSLDHQLVAIFRNTVDNMRL